MIVVVGEALVDVGTGPDGTRETVGGSPLNVAVALARLDAPAILVTELGEDDRATRVRERLHGAGVEVVSSPTRDRRTPTATVLDEGGEPGYAVDLTWDLPHQELPECDALHVGSLATVLEPGRDSVLDLVEQAWARDVFVSYDPNVRADHLTEHAGQIGDGGDQAWRDLVALADRAQLVKLSVQDVAFLHPGADPDQIARALLTGERTELVILTRGADGATGYVDGVAVHVDAIGVEVVDTVGAGDAFTAAVLTVLLEQGALASLGPGLPKDEAGLGALLRAAVEVAGLSCARPGADAPTRQELRPDWP